MCKRMEPSRTAACLPMPPAGRRPHSLVRMVLKVDHEGNVFGARPGGISIFAPDGTQLGSIEIGTPTSNLAWGDDGSTLYITAAAALYRIRLTTKGAGF